VTLKSRLEVTQAWYHLKASVRFLFAFHGTLFYRLQDIAT